MIPLRLTLKNFMSYRDGCPPLDFAPLHTACLTGDNGAGKSALLAAMTWALWGEARAQADDEDLIMQGENDMAVDFEFALGEQAYRVLRQRSRKGKSTSGKLYFQVRDPESGWRDISGDHMRETQRLITARLRMDYDTFINSAFLRQGRADEFTTKNPTERKEILGKILGLERYDGLAEQARERARARESDRRILAQQMADLDVRIRERKRLEEQARELAEYLAAATTELDAVRTEADRLRDLVKALEADEKNLQNVRARAAQDEIAISRADKLIAELEANLARYAEILAGRDVITANWERLQNLRTRERALADQARRHHELDLEIARLERAIDQARNALSNEIGQSVRIIAEARKLADGRAEAERAHEELRDQVAEFDTLDAQQREAQAKAGELQGRIDTLSGANKSLEAEADALNKKRKMLDDAVQQAAAHAHGGRPECPLCGLLLDPPSLQRVYKGYDEDIAARRKTWKANKNQLDALETQMAALKTHLADLETRLKPRLLIVKKEAAAAATAQAARDAEARIAQEQAHLDELQARLDGSHYAQADRAALRGAAAQRDKLNYNPDEHSTVRAEIRTLDLYESRFADLRSAEEKQTIDQARLVHERETRKTHSTRLAEERADERTLAERIAPLVGLRQDAATGTAQVRLLQERFDKLSREQAATERELEAIAASEQDRAVKAAEHTVATAEKTIFDDLAKAFGKAGIQAMIIEQVVPELADEANHLLNRMTDGRMQLSFETQRQARSKDSLIETLDIKITDGAGVARKYEMFSGGEAFRINFAVRVALSKLLARRAGAQLQTLIIDEGFGTQDAQGRERLVQAIRSIQPDFEKILVITHLDELKDEFAARIDVVKTPRGSLATVS
jgi:exonuclease SbcC